jgi:transcriptional regulator with XRE-family HTH domain
MPTCSGRAGFTDRELAELFGVSLSTIEKWKRQREEFRNVLKAGKAEADKRVEQSLYQRAVGYSYEAVKISRDKNGNVIKVPYQEHVPLDVTACIFWLKNRDPAHWRDAWQVEAVTGKYIISDRPMTAEEWIKASGATVIDAEPVAIEDKSECE